MTQAPQQLAADPAAPGAPLARLRELIGLYLELGKARLSGLVVVTAAVGFLLAGPELGGGYNWALLLWTLLGTSLAAGAANALNQVMEVERDARMPRTRGRPLPAGRIGREHAAAVAVFAAGLGVTLLAAAVNFLTAGLCLLTILVYLLAYTPLKTRSTLNTLVGGVVGALPPMMGWAAATGSLDAGAWVLGAVLFVWQIPHFLALAWMYREDYELGGYRMLPSIDPTGGITCRAILLWSLALLPVTLVATWIGLTGYIHAVGALLLGGWLLRLALVLHRRRRVADARRLFIATVLYLPLLMGLMLLDHGTVRPYATGAPSAAQPIAQPAGVETPSALSIPGPVSESVTEPAAGPFDPQAASSKP